MLGLVGPSGYFDQACSYPLHLGHRREPLQGSGLVGFDSSHMGSDQLGMVKAARCKKEHTLHCSEAVRRSLLDCWAHCTNSDRGKRAAGSDIVDRYIAVAVAAAAGSGYKNFAGTSREDH